MEPRLKTLITTIPHAQQRYATLGDWVFDGDRLTITVSETGDPRMNLLIAVHELIEAHLCLERGIAEPDVMAFDVAHPELDDPGSDPRAPYYREHMFAENIERMLALELGVDWTAYGAVCERVWSGG